MLDKLTCIDFGSYMVKAQGLDAMLLFDNGSTDYALEEVGTTLKRTGLKRIVIVSVPFKYGHRTQQDSSRAKFLQTAMLNVARLRFLATAGAVINSDFDELIWSRGGNVFDLTKKSILGFSIFSGEWRFPDPQHPNQTIHAAHDHKLDKSELCPWKYCIVPQGRLKRLSWDVHRLSGLPFKKILRNTDIGFYHCHNTSTHWKGTPSRRGVPETNRDWTGHEFEFDSDARAALDLGLPAPSDHEMLLVNDNVYIPKLSTSKTNEANRRDCI